VYSLLPAGEGLGMRAKKENAISSLQ